MGGVVTVVLREPSGELLKMFRWTNVLPDSLTDPRLFSEDPSGWCEDFKREWLKMRADYQAHHEAGDYECNMTPVYFPEGPAAPSEYGIVFIDLQNKAILSMQDFCCEPATIWIPSLRLQERAARAHELIRKGIVSRLVVRRGAAAKGALLQIPKDGDKEEAFQEVCELAEEKKGVDGHLLIEPPGFDIKRYDGIDGVMKFRAAAEESLGYSFTEEDNLAWLGWIERKFLYFHGDGAAVEEWRKRLGLSAQQAAPAPR
jgi:hypothetical protein